MPDYQLEIKQVVDYPRCRIYREFVQTLIADRSIRTNGGSGLFYYTVLCSYANFRTSYRRLDGITYTVYPGEWVCRVSELTACFRVRFQHKALSILKALQDRQLITFTSWGMAAWSSTASRAGVSITLCWTITAPVKRKAAFSLCPSPSLRS